jgi:hypothetical protein
MGLPQRLVAAFSAVPSPDSTRNRGLAKNPMDASLAQHQGQPIVAHVIETSAPAFATKLTPDLRLDKRLK